MGHLPPPYLSRPAVSMLNAQKVLSLDSSFTFELGGIYFHGPSRNTGRAPGVASEGVLDNPMQYSKNAVGTYYKRADIGKGRVFLISDFCLCKPTYKRSKVG